MNILLIPCTTELADSHFRMSVVGYTKDQVYTHMNFLTDEEKKLICEPIADVEYGRTSVWGLRDCPVNRKIWEALRKGDLVTFYRKTKMDSQGYFYEFFRVASTFENEAYSSYVLFNKQNIRFSLLIVLEEITHNDFVEITDEEVRGALHYSEKANFNRNLLIKPSHPHYNDLLQSFREAGVNV